MFNYDDMKILSREREFFLVLKDGGFVPMADMVKKGRYYRGTNTINNIPVKVLIEDIGGHFYIDDEEPLSNNTYKYIFKQFQAAGDIYEAENLSTDGPFFYANLSVSQKVICALLDKQWDLITLEELKEFWKTRIQQACVKFEEYMESELVESKDNPQFIEELNLLKNQINDEVKSFKELEEFETKEQVCRFWPTILMPAPGFVENVEN